MYMIPVTFENLFFLFFQKWPIFGFIENVSRGVSPCAPPSTKMFFGI